MRTGHPAPHDEYGTEHRGRGDFARFRPWCSCGWFGRWDNTNRYNVTLTVSKRVTQHLIRVRVLGIPF
jgi:hypothetical protein